MKDAVTRGSEMLRVPTGKLPKLAIDFLNKLASESGGVCIETCLTAYAVYAQCVEGLWCDDELYKARPQDVKWFRQNAPPTTPQANETDSTGNAMLRKAYGMLTSSSYWLVAKTTEGHQVKADVHQTTREIEEFLEMPEGDRAYLGDEDKSSNVN